MGHQDKGHYALKHKGAVKNETLAQKITASAKDGQITCASAHRLAGEAGVTPGEIGVQVDLLEYRIIECQLGLFGYAGGEKQFDADITIGADLDKGLEAASQDGRLSCLDCWQIAGSLKIKRLDVGSACEKKKIRIKPCQLGAF